MLEYRTVVSIKTIFGKVPALLRKTFLEKKTLSAVVFGYQNIMIVK